MAGGAWPGPVRGGAAGGGVGLRGGGCGSPPRSAARCSVFSGGRRGSCPLSAVERRPGPAGAGASRFLRVDIRWPCPCGDQLFSPKSCSTPVSGSRPRASPCTAAPLTAQAAWSLAGGGGAAGGGPAAARGAARARAAHRRARPVPPPRRCRFRRRRPVSPPSVIGAVAAACHGPGRAGIAGGGRARPPAAGRCGRDSAWFGDVPVSPASTCA